MIRVVTEDMRKPLRLLKIEAHHYGLPLASFNRAPHHCDPFIVIERRFMKG
jgi:hypothetical protein